MGGCVPERRLVGRLRVEEVVEGGHGGGREGERGEGATGRSVTGERKRQELAHKLSLWVHDPH